MSQQVEISGSLGRKGSYGSEKYLSLQAQSFTHYRTDHSITVQIEYSTTSDRHIYHIP